MPKYEIVCVPPRSLLVIDRGPNHASQLRISWALIPRTSDITAYVTSIAGVPLRDIPTDRRNFWWVDSQENWVPYLVPHERTGIAMTLEIRAGLTEGDFELIPS